MSIIILTNHTPIKYENQYIPGKISVYCSYKSVINQKARKLSDFYKFNRLNTKGGI